MAIPAGQHHHWFLRMRRAQLLLILTITLGGLGASLTLYLYDHGMVGGGVVFAAICLWLFSFYASAVHLANVTTRH